jgi:hypothetical protein
MAGASHEANQKPRLGPQHVILSSGIMTCDRPTCSKRSKIASDSPMSSAGHDWRNICS